MVICLENEQVKSGEIINGELNFENALDYLEKIVEQLESGGLTLDESLQKFTEGVTLVRYCHKELNRAEEKIEMVLKEDGKYSKIVPFNTEEE